MLKRHLQKMAVVVAPPLFFFPPFRYKHARCSFLGNLPRNIFKLTLYYTLRNLLSKLFVTCTKMRDFSLLTGKRRFFFFFCFFFSLFFSFFFKDALSRCSYLFSTILGQLIVTKEKRTKENSEIFFFFFFFFFINHVRKYFKRSEKRI